MMKTDIQKKHGYDFRGNSLYCFSSGVSVRFGFFCVIYGFKQPHFRRNGLKVRLFLSVYL